MKWKRIGHSKVSLILTLPIVLLLRAGPLSAQENIDPDNNDSQYAYGENVGWLNFEPSLGPGVTVTDTAAIGYVWAENIGWINLSPIVTGAGVLNDGTGKLSGYAWGENIGWINFNPVVTGDPVRYGVRIDACGDFHGWAWGENIGWISFGTETSALIKLATAWLSPIDDVAPWTYPGAEIPPWYTGDASITLLTDDCGTGTKEVHYTIDGGSETIVTATMATLNITGDGVHALSFYAVDNQGNIGATTTITIRIDTTPPVIMLNGAASMTLECGVDAYIEPGATAVDAMDPDVPVVIGGDTVNPNICGDYVVTYTAIDDAGNSAQKTRAVKVRDSIAPLIQLRTPAEGASFYVDEIILADFDVTEGGSGIATQSATVPDGSPIDTATADSKLFTVSATDHQGNANTVSHTYTVIPRGNIDPLKDGSQYAYGENVGWLNLEPEEGPGVTVEETRVTGYLWAENIGWVNLSPVVTGAGVLNDGTGHLSGYAWGENVGWINFDPKVSGSTTDYGVTINDQGIFSGWAWGENIGWIHFQSATPVAYQVQTSWKAPVITHPPIAQAGPDQTVEATGYSGAQVTLDGSGSTDPDSSPGTNDDITSFEWYEGGALLASGQVVAQVFAWGSHTVTLTVTDSTGQTNSDDVLIVVQDTTPPSVNAGSDLVKELESPAGTEVTLVGTATDAGDADLSYAWKEGTTVLGTGASLTHVFSRGVHTLTLEATDDSENVGSDVVVVTVADTTAPSVDAGADVSVELVSPAGTQVTLVGTATDVGDADLSYAWKEGTTVLGTGASLTHVFSRGVHTLTLEATDDSGNVGSDTVTVTVVDTIAPSVNAGADVSVELASPAGTQVTLVGAATDAGDVDLSYAWKEGDIVLGTGASLTHVFGRGVHALTLEATDDSDNVGSDTVVVTVVDTTAPLVNAGADVSVELASPAGTQITLLGTALDAGDADLSYTWKEGVAVLGTSASLTDVFSRGVHTLTLEVTDDSGNVGSDTVIVTVVDTIAPSVNAGVDVSVELATPAGTQITLLGTATDAGDADLIYAWKEGDTVLGTGTSLTHVFGLGSHLLTFQATDDSGNVGFDEVTVTVADTIAPTFTSLPQDTLVQRDGNGNQVELQAWLASPVAATDISGHVTIANDFTSFPYQPGNIGSVTVVWTAADPSGNTASASATFTIEDPTAAVTYDGDMLLSTNGAASVNANLVATLRDAQGNVLNIDGEQVTFTLTADGISQPMVVTASTVDGVASSVQALVPAVYVATVTLGTSPFTALALIAVYNPEGGFATGGGWILPEDDGLNTHPNVRANFGFNAKYKNDQATGQLEFRYQDGFIDLKSTSVELLVITGGRIAQFKGLATVNGQAGHRYFVKAIDNGTPGTTDTFEIKIWAPGMDTSGVSSHWAGGVLQGGNIVVHTKDK